MITYKHNEVAIPTFKHFNTFDFDTYEYGVPYRSYFYVHKKSDDLIVISRSGIAIAEFYRNKDIILILSPKIISNDRFALTSLFQYAIRFDELETKISRAGVTSYKFKPMVTIANTNLGKIFSGDVITFSSNRLLVARGDSLVFEPINDNIVVSKDNDKYKEFNKHLKKLKTVITTQAKLGIYDDLTYRWGKGVRDYMSTLTTTSIYNIEPLTRELMELIQNWIRTNDIALVKPIAAYCLCIGKSRLRDSPDAVARRISNAFSHVQKLYLREYCVTISDSSLLTSLTDESKDQNSIILTPDGLREVQVLSKAEVC